MHYLEHPMAKRGALELSVGTIVILVLAMSMLVLGIVLIRNIFTGGTEAVDLINDNVKAQVNSLFNQDENQKTEIYLPGHEAEVKPGKTYNVEFGVKNTLRGVGGAPEFRYAVSVAEIEQGCPITETKANSFIILGRNGRVQIAAGEEPKVIPIKIEIPSGTPLCSLTYNIDVTQAGQFYDQNSFILSIKG